MKEPPQLTEFDFIEEMRIRRWANENHVPPEQRDPSWHPLVLKEMEAIDRTRQETVGDAGEILGQ
jgi:hypothetical protein